jgi:hypothetical protein
MQEVNSDCRLMRHGPIGLHDHNLTSVERMP